MKYRLVLLLCLVALLLFYVFQKNLFNSLQLDASEFGHFVTKKVIRFLVNDFLMLGVIYGLFKKWEYLKLAVVVQLFGLVVLLIPYLTIKAYFPHYNGPLISFLHRLVLNPLLLILLIPALFYQQKLESSRHGK
ncbi:MAG: exosortase F system-associated protein [Bacteroidota bacterium]